MSEGEGVTPTGSPPAPGWGRLEVHPGTGVVHRGPDVLLVVPLVTAALVDVTSELVALCGDAHDPTGRRRIRRVARLLTEAEPDGLPEFALVIDAGDHLAVLVHGDVTVSVTGDREQSFNAAESLAWVERVVPRSYEAVSITRASGQADRAAVAAPTGLPWDLLSGTVPGSGATLQRRAGASPTPAPKAAPSVQEVARVLERPAYLRSSAVGGVPGATGGLPSGPAAQPGTPPADSSAREAPAAPPFPEAPAGTDGRTVLRQTVQLKRVSLARRGRPRGSARRPPLPVGTTAADSLTAALHTVSPIEGVLCPAGHLNDPDLSTCAPCGAPIDPNAPRVTQPRPPLGILVTDEGAVHTLGGDYVIGRDPEQAPDVVAGRARPLVLRDSEHSTSRVHARLQLSGWRVLVSDSGSANGTFVSSSGPAGPWTAVPREPGVPLAPGDRVRLGHRQLLFDRYHLPSTRLQATGKEGSGGPGR